MCLTLYRIGQQYSVNIHFLCSVSNYNIIYMCVCVCLQDWSAILGQHSLFVLGE